MPKDIKLYIQLQLEKSTNIYANTNKRLLLEIVFQIKFKSINAMNEHASSSVLENKSDCNLHMKK